MGNPFRFGSFRLNNPVNGNGYCQPGPRPQGPQPRQPDGQDQQQWHYDQPSGQAYQDYRIPPADNDCTSGSGSTVTDDLEHLKEENLRKMKEQLDAANVKLSNDRELYRMESQ